MIGPRAAALRAARAGLLHGPLNEETYSMAKSNLNTQAKRRRELAKKDKRAAKEQKRATRKAEARATRAAAPAAGAATPSTAPQAGANASASSLRAAFVRRMNKMR
jgi:hypothetical protein